MGLDTARYRSEPEPPPPEGERDPDNFIGMFQQYFFSDVRIGAARKPSCGIIKRLAGGGMRHCGTGKFRQGYSHGDSKGLAMVMPLAYHRLHSLSLMVALRIRRELQLRNTFFRPYRACLRAGCAILHSAWPVAYN